MLSGQSITWRYEIRALSLDQAPPKLGKTKPGKALPTRNKGTWSLMESRSRPMAVLIRTPPSLEDYTPIAEYQSRTPESFFGGTPVLHCHLAGATAYVPASQRATLPFFPADASELSSDGDEVVSQKVDVFITSE